MTTIIRANTVEDSGLESPDGDLRNLRIDYMPGFVATPTAMPRCSSADFLDVEGDENACSDSTAIGIGAVVASATGPIAAPSGDFVKQVPVYNLTTIEGTVGRIGFIAAGQPVVAELGLSQTPPYRGFVRVSDLTQAALFYSAEISIWGVPADPVHDYHRGQCVGFTFVICPVSLPQRPFLTLPRSCTEPLGTGFEATSWDAPPESFATTVGGLGLTGCKKLTFSPQIEAQPTTELADSPSGFDVSLDVFDAGIENPKGVAQSEIKKLVLNLPEGTIVNGEPFVRCAPAQLAQETIDTAPGAGCPLDSQIGTVEVETPPLVGEALEGQVFAAQGDALYIVIKDSQLGILVKQVGEIEFDPFQELLTVTFDHLPQLPVSHLGLHLNDDLLLTPAECDEFDVAAALSPWSDPASSLLVISSFNIVAGPGGGACPSGRGFGSPPVYPAPPGAAPASLNPPPSVVPPNSLKRRRCPKGKRRVRGKARCVRRRCRSTRAGKRAIRRCARPQGRRRR